MFKLFKRKKAASGEETPKKPLEFSKKLILQESILIWIVTLSFIILAFYCIVNQYFGELPWLTAMATMPWVAYGTSQAFFYKKSEKENTKDGINYEKMIRGIETYDDTPVG